MVVGEAAPSECLTARALEIEARGVHEHNVERGQKVAPADEQLFLQNVLLAARRKRRRGVLMVFGQFSPSHAIVR